MDPPPSRRGDWPNVSPRLDRRGPRGSGFWPWPSWLRRPGSSPWWQWRRGRAGQSCESHVNTDQSTPKAPMHITWPARGSSFAKAPRRKGKQRRDLILPVPAHDHNSLFFLCALAAWRLCVKVPRQNFVFLSQPLEFDSGGLPLRMADRHSPTHCAGAPSLVRPHKKRKKPRFCTSKGAANLHESHRRTVYLPLALMAAWAAARRAIGTR